MMGCGKSRVQDIVEPQKMLDSKNNGMSSKLSKANLKEDNKEENNNNPVIEEIDDHSNIRLLLLGAAESGKTTLLEQIRLLYKQNYSHTELFHRKSFIYTNIMQTIRNLIMMIETSDKQFANDFNKKNAELILDEDEYHNGCFRTDVAEAISQVWLDDVVQQLYVTRSTINLNDSTKYFLDNLPRINNLDYQPTPVDLIMSYVPTVGVQNVIFTANKSSFQLFDIGGQKIDRRKWATMYDGIDAIFFCLAISEYDQTMNEDQNTNRLTDALMLLNKISMEKKFEKIPLFLFLNEVDVFVEKFPHIPLQDYQKSFQGKTCDEALDFIENIARDACGNREQSLLFVYRICCIDTDKMSEVLEKVFSTILKDK